MVLAAAAAGSPEEIRLRRGIWNPGNQEEEWTADYTDGADEEEETDDRRPIPALVLIRGIRVIRG